MWLLLTGLFASVHATIKGLGYNDDHSPTFYTTFIINYEQNNENEIFSGRQRGFTSALCYL